LRIGIGGGWLGRRGCADGSALRVRCVKNKYVFFTGLCYKGKIKILIFQDIIQKIFRIIFRIKERSKMEVEPIRDTKKILAIREILKTSRGGLRDDTLFTLGINTALRIGDLLALTVGCVLEPESGQGMYLINSRINLRKEIELIEQKTGKVRKCPLNEVAADVLTRYLRERLDGEKAAGFDGSEPLFLSQKDAVLMRPITRQHAYYIISEAAGKVGLKNIGTHSLRKTFGYHVFKRSGGNIALVQKLLNHSNSAATLRYIGIDKEQMDTTVIDLNLGT
jgi:integrase